MGRIIALFSMKNFLPKFDHNFFPFMIFISLNGKHIISTALYRALDKRKYLAIIRDNFSYFSSEPYVVTPHLNCLDETVQMRGYNIRF